MRSDWPNTSLSLDEWAQIFGWNPFHFWGMADNDVLKVTAQCDAVVYGYSWQDNQIAGRFEIAEAIASAEAMLLRELRWRPGPQYAEATLPWPAYGDWLLTRRRPAQSDGRWLSVNLPEGEILALGTEARTLIGTAAVTLSDPDGDGINERFTATIATSVTDVTEIACYFIAANRLNGDPVSEHYRIRPLDVTIAAGVATIRGPAWLLVTPIQSQGFRMVPKNPADAGVLAASIEVYRRYTNTNSTDTALSQALIVWETDPSHGWWCGCSGCSAYGSSPFDPAATAQAVARAGIRDARIGIVHAAEASYDATTGIWSSLDWAVCTEPDRVTIRYLAGKPLVNFRMDRAFAQVVARLAAAELARPICSCEVANWDLARWQFDRARVTGADDESYATDAGDLSNPFGTRLGHIQAWHYVQGQKRLRGFNL